MEFWYVRDRKYVVEKHMPVFFSINNGSFLILTSGRPTMIGEHRELSVICSCAV